MPSTAVSSTECGPCRGDIPRAMALQAHTSSRHRVYLKLHEAKACPLLLTYTSPAGLCMLCSGTCERLSALRGCGSAVG